MLVRVTAWQLALVTTVAACGSSNAGGGATAGDAGKTTDAATGASTDATTGAVDAAAGDVATVTTANAEAPGDAGLGGDVALLGDASAGPRGFTLINHCAATVWAAANPATTLPGGLVEMAPGYSFEVQVADGWSGRVWGKTGCAPKNGKIACDSDAFPASLAELTLTKQPDGGLDFYDVSLVDGFNLPIEIVALGHTPNPSRPYDCGDPACVVDLDTTCPAAFQDVVDGVVVACANDACKVIGGNDAGSPACVYPNEFTRYFKTPCPTAYSFPSDDPTSTFTCRGQNSYAVVFCPSAAP
jgi:hypothetical protein